MHDKTPVAVLTAPPAVAARPRLAAAPADWPGPGPIDLQLHDRPHASSTTEWWYLNAHLTDAGGRERSLFVSFFRRAIGYDEQAGRATYAHWIAWALCDPVERRYLLTSLLDRSAPEVGLRHLARDDGPYDHCCDGRSVRSSCAAPCRSPTASLPAR